MIYTKTRALQILKHAAWHILFDLDSTSTDNFPDASDLEAVKIIRECRDKLTLELL